jgi:hypothetical protein
MTGSLQLHEYPGDIVRLFCEKCVQLISPFDIGHTENLSLQSGKFACDFKSDFVSKRIDR